MEKPVPYRIGIAMLLIRACELVCQEAGLPGISLHVQQADPAAQALYLKSGFDVVDSDPWWTIIRHSLRPRHLMVKMFRE